MTKDNMTNLALKSLPSLQRISVTVSNIYSLKKFNDNRHQLDRMQISGYSIPLQ